MRWPLLVLLVLTGCSPAGEEAGGTAGADAPQRIAVIPKGTTHEFWKAVHAGAVQAERELKDQGADVEVIWQGPLKEDDRDTQIQVLETFVARQVAGIVLAPLDSRALVRPVEAAVASGIPVVVIDSGLDSERHTSFVATDNYAGGALAARHLAGLLEGEGDVILFRYAVGSASTEARERGFLETLEADHPRLRVISSTEYAGPTRETAYRTAQALLNRFGSEVDGIFAVNESATIGMTLALKEAGRAQGAVAMIGFDAGSQSIDDLEHGDVQGLVVQNPMRMGYEGVMTVVQAIQGESVERRVDTGVVLVTPENLRDADVQPLLDPPIQAYLSP